MRQALELALKFVEDSECGTADLEAHIKEALAQPERDYERGFIDGMQKQMQSSVDKAVNRMAQPEQTNTRPYYTIDELNAWADEKEKQAWRNAAIRVGEELSSVGPDGYYDMNAWQWLDWAMENVKKAQPEQEPVAYLCENAVGHKYFRWKKPSSTYKPIALYATPPQRTWVGLTDEEIADCAEKMEASDPTDSFWREFFRGIEAKLKEKNT
jgi:hypothetical protein